MRGTKKWLVLAALLLSVFLLTACATKVPRSPAEFSSLLEDLGYEILDAQDNYDSAAEVTEVLFARAADGSHQIEYYVFETDDVAAARFAGNYNLLESRRGSSYTQSYSNRQNSGSYKLTTADGYYALVRVDSIIVYCATAKEQKDAVVAAFKALGY